MRNEFHSMLATALGSGELIAVYRDPQDLDCWNIGRVTALTDSHYTLTCVSPTGRADGTDSSGIERIVRIGRDTRYLRRLALLEKNQAKVYGSGDAETHEFNGEDCIAHELAQAKSRRHIVSLECASDMISGDVVGFVKKLSATHVSIAQVDEHGEPDGVITLRLWDITRLQRNDEDAKKLAFFFQNRKRLYGDMR